MNQIERIRAVTANYFLWQGLRISAMGPILIVSGLNLLEPSWYPFDAESGMLLLLVVTILGLLGSWALKLPDITMKQRLGQSMEFGASIPNGTL